MKLVRGLWTAALAVTIGCWVFAPRAGATMVTVTFEEPTYSATFTHSGLPAGTINTQDGWNSFFGFGVGNMNVSTVNPISGLQSLLVNNSSSTSPRGQASGLLNVTIPASMSWLVRVDALGGGTGSAGSRGAEFGITTDPVTAPSPFTIIFNDAGNLQYYNLGNTNFPGGPIAYSLNTVYRVDITNMSDVTGKYDAAIVNTSTNTTVASVTGAPLQAAIGNSGVYFYAVRRGNATGNARVDNISAFAAIPEPSSLVFFGCASFVAIIAMYLRKVS